MYLIIQDTHDELYRRVNIVEGEVLELSYWDGDLDGCANTSAFTSVSSALEGRTLQHIETGRYLTIFKADTLEELKLLVLLES